MRCLSQIITSFALRGRKGTELYFSERETDEPKVTGSSLYIV